MKKSILTMLLLLMAIASFAQQRLISGQITDRDTKEAIEQVTIQLLKSDSTYVAGAISNENGLFHVTAPANGKYLLKISSVGYKSTVKRIQISDNKDLAMGKIVLGAEAIMLKGAVVTAMAQKVTLKEDTFVYNSSAYRTPEGSVVEELVKRLRGAEGSLPFFARAPKMAMDSGVRATTKNGLNCWKSEGRIFTTPDIPE